MLVFSGYSSSAIVISLVCMCAHMLRIKQGLRYHVSVSAHSVPDLDAYTGDLINTQTHTHTEE